MQEKRESMLLPLAQRQQMEYEYAVFAWANFNQTIARMQSYGEACMRVWFPKGLPPQPQPRDFGPTVKGQ